MTGISGEAAVTTRVKSGNAALDVPSVTRMLMLLYEPASAAVGTPVNAPVAVLNVAQAGQLLIAKVKGFPAASLATGTKV
jgi:hypothetical protein